ncbi:MAG: DUF368 domain-containing protein [Calditrichaeota bacterium]|nr:MAG: DUF368 domain-containing protein [Calditrichota bacterium]
MNQYIRVFIVGMAMGVANIIPGVSGGTIAVVFGIYEQLMEALGNFLTDKENRRRHIIFLSVLFSGSLIAIAGLAGLLKWSFNNYPLITVYLFIGLILGSIPIVLKVHKDMKPTARRVVVFVLTVGVVVALALMQHTAESGEAMNVFSGYTMGDYLYFAFAGLIAASAMIIPGVSGSFILILLGVYWTVLGALSGLFTQITSAGLSHEVFNRLMILGSLFIGVVMGIFGFSKIMDFLLKRFPALTMYAILGLIIGSLYQIYPGFEFSIQGAGAVLSLLVGVYISIKFSPKDSKIG